MLQTVKRVWVCVLFATAMTGCGPSVGDPCTIANECGNGVCLNQGFAPGGYCSKPCTPGEAYSCPAGTECVKDGLGKNEHRCFRTCQQTAECRPGYACRSSKGSGPICVGPGGL